MPRPSQVDEITLEEQQEKREQAARKADLAKQAFEMMDVSGDGNLTKMEVIRAYRLNEHVREVMLPLLDVATDKYSVTGVNVKAQVEAFEDAFRKMDADGTNEVSLDEFMNFFAKGGKQKAQGPAHGKKPRAPSRAGRRALFASSSTPALQQYGLKPI